MNGIRTRSSIVFIGFALVGLAVLVKLFIIQLAQGDHWRAKAEKVAFAEREVRPVRGDIYSDDGSLLATIVPRYNVRLDLVPDALTDSIFNAGIQGLSKGLAEVLGGRDAEGWKRELTEARRARKRYYLLKRDADHAQVTALRQLPILDRGRVKGGLIVERDYKRKLLRGRLAQRTIGTINDDTASVYPGIEGGYDQWLRGVTGRRLHRRLAGDVWMPVDDGKGVDPVPGCDVHSTIDINLQDVADAVLEKQIREHGAQHGTVIVMEVATGYIKAVSNLTWSPDSNTCFESRNHAIGVRTEPGSTFKLPALMVGIEDGLISPTDTVDTGWGKVQYHGVTMEDSKRYHKRYITVARAFELSLNTGCSKAVVNAYGKDPQRFVAGLERMGFGQPTGIGIPGEADPILPRPGERRWSGLSLPWMSIGYGVEATPLQILAFYNAVANNGRMMRPQLVRRITRNGRTVAEFEPEVVIDRICSQRTLDIAHRMLRAVVDSGTATNLREAHFPVAGKTGTAVVSTNGNYALNGRKTYRASFAGFFPAENPVYSCIVSITGPSGPHVYGNVVAGTVFREIANKVHATRPELHRYGSTPALAAAEPQGGQRVPITIAGHAKDLAVAMGALGLPFLALGEGAWVTTRAADSVVVMSPRNVPGEGSGTVPDVTGMGLRDALYLLERQGLRVRVQGAGMVRRQSIAPGTRTNTGTTILIELA
jgi:cell division protein FtsI (penicillin-binding protein 3)